MAPGKSALHVTDLDAIEQLRDRIASRAILDVRKLNSSNFLLRYLKANCFNVDRAEKMIETYLKTLEEKRFDSLASETFADVFTDFAIYSGGWDNQGRPVIMVPQCGLWNVKEIIQNGHEEMFIRYIYKLTFTFEKLVLETDSDYGIFVGDMRNISYETYFHKRTLEVLVYLFRLMEKIAPGLVGKVYLVNASKFCVAIFGTVKRIVQFSSDVYVMDSNEEKWKASLMEFIPEEGICPHFGGVLKNVIKL